MAVIQQQPTFNQQAANIEHQKKLAQMLRSQAKYDMAPNASVSVGPYTNVVPMSPIAALAQGLREGVASYNDASASKQEAELADKKQQALSTMFSGENDPSMQDMAQSGLFDGDVLVNALLKKQQAKEAAVLKAEERQQKLNDPTTGMREALWAAGGDDAKARELLQNKIQNPLGMLNYQLQAQNVATDNARQEQQLQLQREAMAMQQQNASRQQQIAERTANKSDYSAELQDWRLQNPNYEKNQAAIADAETELEKLTSGIAAYKDLLGKFSNVDRHNPMSNSDLQTAYQSITWPLRSETMINTGVLNPGDKAALEAAITDPTAWNAKGFRSNEELNKQLDEILNVARRNVDAVKSKKAPMTQPPLRNKDAGFNAPAQEWQKVTDVPSEIKQLKAQGFNDEAGKLEAEYNKQQQKVIRYDANGNRIQ